MIPFCIETAKQDELNCVENSKLLVYLLTHLVNVFPKLSAAFTTKVRLIWHAMVLNAVHYGKAYGMPAIASVSTAEQGPGSFLVVSRN